VQRAAHHTVHALSGALAELNLTPAEINVLANLAGRGALNVRELSTETGTRSSTLTGVLDRLENRGYVRRELDPTDRRSFRLPLTAVGQTMANQVHTAVAALETGALGSLSAAQVAGFHAVVNALLEA